MWLFSACLAAWARLTHDQDEHSSVAGMGILRTDANEITCDDRGTATDQEWGSTVESVREVTVGDEGDGSENIDWDGHVVDLDGFVSRERRTVSKGLG